QVRDETCFTVDLHQFLGRRTTRLWNGIQLHRHTMLIRQVCDLLKRRSALSLAWLIGFDHLQVSGVRFERICSKIHIRITVDAKARKANRGSLLPSLEFI